VTHPGLAEVVRPRALLHPFADGWTVADIAKLSDPERASDGIFSDSFYVKFSDPALARAIAPSISPMPGVMAVVPVVSEK
jgi:hypothetical protein